MINRHDNPVQWVLLMDQLEEAHEHLGKLIAEMRADSGDAEEQLRIYLGHVMAHLNRAWASRNITRELTDAEWESFREYPRDLSPIA